MKIRFLPMLFLVLGFTQLSLKAEMNVKVVNRSSYDLSTVEFIPVKKKLRIPGRGTGWKFSISNIQKGRSKSRSNMMFGFDIKKLKVVFRNRGLVGNATKNVRIGRLKFDYKYTGIRGRSYADTDMEKLLITVYDDHVEVTIVSNFG